MRIFIALDLPESAKEMLRTLQQRLVEMNAGGRPVPASDMHITLRFFDELSDEQVDIAGASVETVALSCPAPMLTIAGTGGFVRSGGDTVYARLGGNLPAVTQMHRLLTEELDKNGIKPDIRIFYPHITLMRAADYRVANQLAVKSDFFFGSSVTMYRSILKPTGPIYDQLLSVPLAR